MIKIDFLNLNIFTRRINLNKLKTFIINTIVIKMKLKPET